ncbi:MAG: DUF3237 domain-containing protein [Dehalococcoidia bacterium]|nr:DUF3237 domain-containing protein [Dehalococcoidia bacterium]
MADLRSAPLFELTVRFGEADESRSVGQGGRGERVIAPAASGSFEGEHLRGVVVPPWPDYILRRPDGVSEHEIRAVLQTDDGALIYMQYEGIGHRQDLGPLGSAEGALYFRTVARFETEAARYAWLNRVIAVAVSHPAGPRQLGWSFHAIL